MRDPLLKSRPLATPRVFVLRMTTFLAVVLCLAVLIWHQLWLTFLSNPALNGLIVGIMVVGILLALGQVWRLFPEVRWVNSFGGGNISVKHKSALEVRLLSPLMKILGDDTRRQIISPQAMRSLLEAIGMRLDESREIVRYLTGLLVFLGLLGTFWGLTLTIRSVGQTVQQLDPGATDLGVAFGALKQGLISPLDGMGTAFSSSLFGLGGSLVLGFIGLQANQAQARFYTQLEDWLAGRTAIVGAMDVGEDGRLAGGDLQVLVAAIDRLGCAVADDRDNRETVESLGNVADELRELAQQFKEDHVVVQGWVKRQIDEQRDMRRYLEGFVDRQHYPPRGSG